MVQGFTNSQACSYHMVDEPCILTYERRSVLLLSGDRVYRHDLHRHGQPRLHEAADVPHA